MGFNLCRASALLHVRTSSESVASQHESARCWSCVGCFAHMVAPHDGDTPISHHAAESGREVSPPNKKAGINALPHPQCAALDAASCVRCVWTVCLRLSSPAIFGWLRANREAFGSRIARNRWARMKCGQWQVWVGVGQ